MITPSTYDIALADRIEIGLMKCVGKHKAAKSKLMVKRMREQGFEKVNAAKIREIVHYLRTVRHVFICGDSAGYYAPESDEDKQHQIKSLTSRIREITEVRDALVQIRSNQFKQVEIFV